MNVEGMRPRVRIPAVREWLRRAGPEVNGRSGDRSPFVHRSWKMSRGSSGTSGFVPRTASTAGPDLLDNAVKRATISGFSA